MNVSVTGLAVDRDALSERSKEDLLRRNAVVDAFFLRESSRLAEACQEMSRRFLAGGRLLAFGRGAAATDAQHVSVEFVHPVIVGKRALPAVDLGPEFASYLPVLVQPNDMVMGFALSGLDPAMEATLRTSREQGALTFDLIGNAPDSPLSVPTDDSYICQEVFEILYHVLWETVHVYFEHREQGHDVGASAFLYPFLGKNRQDLGDVVLQVQHSMQQKAAEVNAIRAAVADSATPVIADLAPSIVERLAGGGKIFAFGNGGSATDANDFVVDCLVPPRGMRPVPAISLSAEPANITAVANDIGSEAIFARQIIAHGKAGDVAIAISTSGNSPNILAALAEARKRGLMTVAMAGYDGGRVLAEDLADHVLVVHSDYIPRIQEAQASLYHVLRRRIGELQGTTEFDA